MTETENGILLEFDSKAAADQFLSDVKKTTRLYLYISLADMKMLRKNGSHSVKVEDFRRGYNKADVRAVKPKKNESTGKWEVCFGVPGQMFLDKDGIYKASGRGGE